MTLPGKIFTHLTNKVFFSYRKLIPLSAKCNNIISVGSKWRELYVIIHLKIAQQLVHGLSVGSTADEVHAGFKLCTVPLEALQTAANLV